MKKSDLVSAVAKKTGLTVKDTEEAINGLFEEITDAMAKKDKVTLVGFGTFSTSDRAARDGVNPATGAKIKISARTVPVFKAGKALKEKVK